MAGNNYTNREKQSGLGMTRKLLALLVPFLLLCCKSRDDDADVKNAPSAAGAAATVSSDAPRLEAESPWFRVAPDDVDVFLSFSGFKPVGESTTEGERFHRLAIGKKALAMVEAAKTTLVASAFLFDSMYSTNPEQTTGTTPEQVQEEKKITQVFRDKLIEKRHANPNMLIAVVLDPINRAYLDRISPAVAQFRAEGIDVFYSDLAATPPVGHNNAGMKALQELHRNDVHVEDVQTAVFNTIALAIQNAPAFNPIFAGQNVDLMAKLADLKAGKPLEIQGQKLALDGQPITLELAYNVALLKANHRKLLVTDSGSTYEALVSSANPHNASFGAANSALSIKGEAAKYVYNVIRADVEHSIERENTVIAKFQATRPEEVKRWAARFAFWSNARSDAAARTNYLTETFPPLSVDPEGGAGGPAEARFVTENKIAQALADLLGNVEKGDEVRIQMFYLSYPPVIEAILAAAKKVDKPLRLILDPNKDAFNKTKDGTPNRQVARYILAQKAADPSTHLELRWYSTHGEQNHAKIMSITNAATGKSEIVTGSGNWTGKNIGGPNMEANLVLKGAPAVTQKFNDQFDAFWVNKPDPGETSVEYTIAYNDGRYKYDLQTADDAKWKTGEESGLVSW